MAAYPDALPELYKRCADALVARFREREENVLQASEGALFFAIPSSVVRMFHFTSTFPPPVLPVLSLFLSRISCLGQPPAHSSLPRPAPRPAQDGSHAFVDP